MEIYIWYSLAAINVITFMVYGIDKLKAKRENGAYRKPPCSYWPSLAGALGLGAG